MKTLAKIKCGSKILCSIVIYLKAFAIWDITPWWDVYLGFGLCWQLLHNKHLSSAQDQLPRLVARCQMLRCVNSFQRSNWGHLCHQQPDRKHLMIHNLRTAMWDCPPPCFLRCLKETKHNSHWKVHLNLPHGKICWTDVVLKGSRSAQPQTTALQRYTSLFTHLGLQMSIFLCFVRQQMLNWSSELVWHDMSPAIQSIRIHNTHLCDITEILTAV